MGSLTFIESGLTFFNQSQVVLPLLFHGVYFTVIVTVGAFSLATVLGLLRAFMRVGGMRPRVSVKKPGTWADHNNEGNYA